MLQAVMWGSMGENPYGQAIREKKKEICFYHLLLLAIGPKDSKLKVKIKGLSY